MRLLLLLLAALPWAPPWLVLGRSVGPVNAVNDLITALRDVSVDQIILGSGVFTLDATGGVGIGPNRHVELVGSVNIIQFSSLGDQKWTTAPAPLHYASGIDFGNSAQGLFRLGDNTTLGFRNVVLWHGLSQLGYDWQVIALAQPGARASVRFYQTVKLRDGCLPLQIFAQHIASYKRLHDTSSQQNASVQPLCFVPPARSPPVATAAGAAAGLVATVVGQNSTGGTSNVTCITETLAIDNLATSITRSNGQSYDLYEQGGTYWCLAYASMSCLSASGPEQCVKELEGAVANGTTSQAAAGGGEDEGNHITNILVPAVITGVLVLALVTTTVWCIRRRGAARQRRGSSLGANPPGGGSGGDLEGDLEGGGRGVGARVGDALARLLPGAGGRDAARRKPHVPGYVPVVSKEALDRIAKVRAELSSKMVVASSADDLSDVRNLHLVGKGTFGRVYKGEWKGVTVALKVISVPVSQYGQAQWQQVLGEAAISTLLNHPCVLQTYSVALLEYSPALKPPVSNASEEVAVHGGASSGKGSANSGAAAVAAAASGAQLQLDDMAPFYQLKMVSEFCEGGSVVQALRRMHFYDSVGLGAMRLPAVIDIASQVASGMAYLHSANIIHADLKAANVLLKQQPGSGRLQAKVADFGLSFRLEGPEATHMTKGQLGSITHMAPEVLLQGRVSKSSDVYSFGILLYELYMGQQAYCDVPQPMLAYHVATAGGRPLLPSHCPAAYRGLAKTCWSSETASRPTFEELYKRLQGLAEEISRAAKSLPPRNRNNNNDQNSDAGDEMAPAPAAAAAGQLQPGVAAAAADTEGNNEGRVAPPPSQDPSAAAAAPPAATPAPELSKGDGNVGMCGADAAAADAAAGGPQGGA